MMPTRFRPLIFFIILIVGAVVLLYLIFEQSRLFQKQEGLLEVTFIDVGQGDATFIESPAGTQVLIDGGRDASVLRGLSRTMGYFDRDIDLLVATHPDLDHIGGLIDVLGRYQVRTVLITENENDTPASATFRDAVAREGAVVLMARRGQVYDLGLGSAGSTTLTILFPDRDPSKLESNTSSVVAQLRYGTTEVMLTGDSPQAIEEYLVSLDATTIESDVLKAGHHGSRTSSSELFVRAVGPSYAIISAGKDNDYGHPHKEAIDLFRAEGVTTKNTAESGSIFLESDGQKIWFR